MARRAGEHHRLGGQRGEKQTVSATVDRREESEVQASLADPIRHGLGAADVAHTDRDAGVIGAERRQQAGNADRAHSLSLHRAEHHQATQPLLHLSDGVRRQLDGVEHMARLGQEGPPGIVEPHVTGVPIEQASPELALQ
jgi:hypothetical protein